VTSVVETTAAAPLTPVRRLRLPAARAGLALALPAVLVLVFLYVIPLARLIAHSFDGANVDAYRKLLDEPYGRLLTWNAVRLGVITTVLALAIGYPAAFGLAFARGALRSVFLASLFLPLAASVIVKAFAWTILLRSHGLVNETLMAIGLIHAPIRMIFTQVSLITGSVNIFLPFMVLPIYAVVAQIDPVLSEAAATLGASPLGAFLRVVVPLSLPGVVAGVALVFSLSVSAYVVPTLLMGENYPTLATTIAKAFLLTRDPALGSAAGTILMTIGLIVVILGHRYGERSAAP
jgi:putative spermidine/putrescine transport system permease protein